MRLFIAIRFDRDTEAAFAAIRDALRARSVTGTFTRTENMHLTLAFLGETTRLREAKRAVEALQGAPFPLVFRGFGRFARTEGDLCWVGVERSPALLDLHNQLGKSLRKSGFAVEGRPFRPHITLGRRVVPAPDFDRESFAADLPEIRMTANAVSLMESARIQGRLTYTPLLTKPLEEAAL